MHPVRPTVLVVDDDNETRVEFATWLSDAGYSCITAGDAQTALWFARRLSPAAVVVDVGRRHERLRLASCLGDEHSATGVVVTSATGSRPLASLPSGVCCHVSKPSRPAELVAAVQRATVMRQQADDGARERRRDITTILATRQQQLGDVIAGGQTAEAAHAALRATFEGRLPALFSHARRVAQLAATLADALLLPNQLARVIEGAALLHDIGKLTLPEAVLLGHHTVGDAEIEALGNHHARTLALLGRAPALAPIARLVQFVHARWDGSGIPWGLAAEDIPIGARVVAVADALDAARGRDGHLAAEGRYGALTRGAGTSLDPELVRVCLHTLEATQQPVVRVATSTEGGEAPRGQAGVPATRFVGGGVEGATTENIDPIFEEGAAQATGMHRRPNAGATVATGCKIPHHSRGDAGATC